MIPEFLITKLKNEYCDIADKILSGYMNRKTTLRVNTLKSNLSEIEEELKNSAIVYKNVAWNKDALIIENASEVDIQKLSIYEDGKIYLQSLSSMIPPIIVDPKANETILDMAAAPGGKTTQMVNLSDNKAMITACEKNKIRAEKLKYNLLKQGANRVTVMIQDARNLDDFFSFDKILLDAPCSGSGTLNEQDNVEKYFTEELIERSVKTQKELLKKAVRLVKSGGTIIYSTCSILKEENEEVVKEACSKYKLKVEPIDLSGFNEIPLLPVSIEGTMCVCPNELYEGFFVAKLKKI
ncbi:MAG: RsmB/NOP family class I SAM-dependent RNA methyltransferase [Clostridia bacterium]|nr:RsmB/NOP family class I SAM-dependent RNA methyltransferase [Clostridia bacterium]